MTTNHAHDVFENIPAIHNKVKSTPRRWNGLHYLANPPPR